MLKSKAISIIKKFAKVVGFFKIVEGILHPYSGELELLAACLKDVGEKRERALQRLKYVRKYKKVLMKYSEDDLYADDEFYKNRIRQCYAENTRFRRSMGMT